MMYYNGGGGGGGGGVLYKQVNNENVGFLDFSISISLM